MNKTLTLTLLAAASGAAMAQSATPNSVTLYGLVDVGVQRVTGYAKGTDTALVSGIMEGTRFGLRGNEDLG
ncbi:MAG: porin, partial [Pseudomonadota bacterium]